jgi:hypothetical protein
MGDTQVVLVGTRQQAVREELGRLLESAAFRSSKRCREFLQYVVEQTVNGPSGSLKERSIGIELFGLPQDFDTSQHTIVRVTASETRKKLAQYYHTENGTHHQVRIELPPGSYNAEFAWSSDPDPEPPSTPGPEPAPAMAEPTRRGFWLAAGGGVALLAGGGAALWPYLRSRKPEEGSPKQPLTSAAGPVAAAPTGTAEVRVAVGALNPYLDRNGQSWGVDRYFTGGQSLARPAERIVRTLDPDLYRRFRAGDFRYDIPLAPGATYEMHLHFAETGLSDFISAESSGEGQRVFRISANGKILLDYFDVVADAAGANTANQRVFRDITAAEDGLLHLAFQPLRGSAMVSGIELVPVTPGKVNPLRIRSGWPAAWRDGAGSQWRADSFFLGGNALVRRTNPARDSEHLSPDNALYTSERWGNFSYAIPVADGRYRVTLRFCEGHYGSRNTGNGGVGSRMFDVYCNGVALLRDFDVMREAGGEGRPVDRVYPGVRPNAQGKIQLSFVPNKGMAFVNGIEVVDES